MTDTYMPDGKYDFAQAALDISNAYLLWHLALKKSAESFNKEKVSESILSHEDS